ncbi:MAG: hypothetical protein JXR19_08375 [Bacteroidia bacterium]
MLIRKYSMISDFLTPLSTLSQYENYQIGANIIRYVSDFPSLENCSLALVGIQKDKLIQEAEATESIRNELYKLSFNPMLKSKMLDLGNIVGGEQFSDTELALKEVVKHLVNHGITVLIIGHTAELAQCIYEGCLDLSHNLDLTFVSSKLPLLDGEVLSRICQMRPNQLFNINALAYQSHFIPFKSQDILTKLNFSQLRLGSLKAKLEDAEPLIRNSHLFIFDIDALKYSESPASSFASPNGLDGDQACKLGYYGGVSDLTQVFALFGMDSQLDVRNQSAKLSAQMFWYFMEGFASRVNDHPGKHDEFMKYRCNIDQRHHDLIFHKSKRTSRWWMEVPNPKSLNNADRNVIVPCSYADYQAAANGEIPDRYLSTVQKMH